MKKYIYNLFMVLFATATMTSCAEDEGTEPGKDSTPSIIIYQYAPDESYNPDNDVVLRFATNSKTNDAYYLVELATDKDAHIAAMGEDGYKDYVIENGIKLDDISNASNEDVILTGLVGEYTITAVAVNGGAKTAKETTFVGLSWESIGVGTLTTSFFGNVTIPCEFYKSSPVVRYKAIEPYDAYDLTFSVVGNNASLARQPMYTDYDGYGTLYMAGSGTFKDNIISISASFSVSAGTFSGSFDEIFTLPTVQ